MRPTPRTLVADLEALAPTRSAPRPTPEQVDAAAAAIAGTAERPPLEVPGLVELLAWLAIEQEERRGWQRLAAELLAELLREQAWADALERDGEWAAELGAAGPGQGR